MKERLILALSWYAFAHGLLVGVFLIEPDFSYDYYKVYDSMFWGSLSGLHELVFFGISPAIWLGLWITAGTPRILPWQK